MQELTILEAIPLLIWAGNLALILVLGIGSVLGSFWFRTEVNMVNKIQKFKWRTEWDGHPLDWLLYVVICESFIGFLTAMFIGKMIASGVMLPILLVIGILILTFYAPRFAIDLIKGLKVNNKTGDLDRINKLEKELASLKTKVEEK